MRGGGGGRGNGGRGGGGFAAGAPGVDLQAARQLFFSLFGGGQQVGGGGGAGGGSGGGGARKGGGGGRLRDGEWPCQCGFPNRAYREQCFACGRNRPAGAEQRSPSGKGVGTSAAARAKGAGGGWDGKGRRSGGGEVHRWGGSGPVGANGSRPLLGAYGAKASKAPAGGAGVKGGLEKGKGAAGGKPGGGCGKGPAKGSAMGGSGQQDGGADGARATAHDNRETLITSKGAWARPPPFVDSEGYTLVQPRKTWQSAAPVEGSKEEATPGDGTRRSMASRPRWADVDEQSEDEAYAEEDLAAEDQDDAGDGAEVGDRIDPGRLRAKYESLARAVRDMEKRAPGGQDDDPAIVTLREARDAAEGAWRQAKSPAPLPTRMGRAQVKMDRAEAALTKARYAVDEFDEWAEAHRKELMRQVDEADAWFRWRQQQMEELHQEAGGRANCGGGNGGGDTTCSAAVSGRLIGDLPPKVHALMEYVQGNPEIEAQLAGIAEGLHSAGQELDGAQKGTPEHYDIGNGDAWNQGGSGHDWERDDDEHMGGMDHDHGGAKGGKAMWRPEGEGRWTRARLGQGASAATAAGLRDANGPHNVDSMPGTGAAQAAATEQAGATPGGAGNGNNGNKRGAGEPEDAKGAVRQRTEAEAREEADRRRAAELLEQQQRAIAAQQASHEAGAGGFGSETAQSVAAQQFVAEVCKTVERARKKGVEPRAEGKELVELTPMELKQWIADKLGDEADWA